MKINISSDTIVDRVLYVCAHSGFRNRGIFTCIDDNRVAYSALKKRSGMFEKFPWVEGWIEAHDVFWANLLAAVQPSFPDAGKHGRVQQAIRPWPGRDDSRHIIKFETTCRLDRIIRVCAPNVEGGGLFQRLDENREFLQLIYKMPDEFEYFFWIEPHLENQDLFFEDLRLALGACLSEPTSVNFPRPWPGKNYSRYLLRFDSSGFEQFFNVNIGTI